MTPLRLCILTPFLLFILSFGLPALETGTRNTKIEDLVYLRLFRFRNAVFMSAEDFGVDPALMFAILYVEKTQYELDLARKYKKQAEELFASFRLFARNLPAWARLSVGYTHMKPQFAAETFKRLAEYPHLSHLISSQEALPEVYMESEEVSIKLMAASLFLLSQQWKQTPGAADISRRPEILATLYNLGYEKSVPHGAPRSGGSVMPVILDGILITGLNFGERVKLLMESGRKFQSFMEP